MNTQEVANRLITLCREGKNMQAIEELYHEDVVSIEPSFTPQPEVKGKAAVIEKDQNFFGHIKEVHSSFISDAEVAGSYFTMVMRYDVTTMDGNRMDMKEVAVYQVKEGEIVFEQFFFDIPNQA